MNDDWNEFLQLLNSNEVQYVIIGAHAMALHGYVRNTEDIDLWMGRTRENVTRLAVALKEFGTPFPPGGEEAFMSDSNRMVRLGIPPNRIDILNFGAGIPFEEVWNRKVEAKLGGIKAFFISREDFIQSKRDAGRHKDLGDLKALGEL